jgi:hypothetical protein
LGIVGEADLAVTGLSFGRFAAVHNQYRTAVEADQEPLVPNAAIFAPAPAARRRRR